jgi:Emfourin
MLLILLSLILACGPSTGSGLEGTVSSSDAVIIYSREGGFAGVSQEWVIHLDGTINAPAGETLTVSPEAVRELVEIGAETNFANLAGAPTPDACCDQFVYTLTFSTADQSWSLSTTDSAEQDPVVSELFDMAAALIASAEPASG